MAEPWIRVHADLADKPVVFRAADALRVTTNEAIGLLVRLWGKMSRLGDDGHIDRLTDAQIESWAGWRGKRGVFAAFIREHHTDDEGRIREWDEYNGALETRRANDRDRQQRRRDRIRSVRVGSAGRHADDAHDSPRDDRRDSPRDVHKSSAPARAVRNETKRNSTTTPKTTTSRDTAAGGSNGASEQTPESPRVTWLTPICTAWEAQSGAGSFASVAKQAAGALRALVRAGHEPATIAAHLEVYLARTSPQFRSITRFAQSFAEWAPTAGGGIVDGWMSPELERATRPQP